MSDPRPSVVTPPSTRRGRVKDPIPESNLAAFENGMGVEVYVTDNQKYKNRNAANKIVQEYKEALVARGKVAKETYALTSKTWQDGDEWVFGLALRKQD